MDNLKMRHVLQHETTKKFYSGQVNLKLFIRCQTSCQPTFSEISTISITSYLRLQMRSGFLTQHMSTRSVLPWCRKTNGYFLTKPDKLLIPPESMFNTNKQLGNSMCLIRNDYKETLWKNIFFPHSHIWNPVRPLISYTRTSFKK